MKKILLALLILLPGCSMMPAYDRVDKKQDFELGPMKKRFDVWIVDDAIVARACGEDAAACLVEGDNKHYAVIFVREDFEYRKFALEHEFNHVVYGPKHR